MVMGGAVNGGRIYGSYREDGLAFHRSARRNAKELVVREGRYAECEPAILETDSFRGQRMP